jgi:hypothetical protein
MESARTVRVQRYLFRALTFKVVVQAFVPADAATGRESFVFSHDDAYFQSSVPPRTSGSTANMAPQRVGDVDEVEVPAAVVDLAYALAVANRTKTAARAALRSVAESAERDPTGFVEKLRLHLLDEIAAGRQESDCPLFIDGNVVGRAYSLGPSNHCLLKFDNGRSDLVFTLDAYNDVLRRERDAERCRRGEPPSPEDSDTD